MGCPLSDWASNDCGFCLPRRLILLSLWLKHFHEANCHVGEAHTIKTVGGFWPIASEELNPAKAMSLAEDPSLLECE